MTPEHAQLIDLLLGRLQRLRAWEFMEATLYLESVGISEFTSDILLKEAAHMERYAAHMERGGQRRREPCPCCGWEPCL